MRLDDAVTYFLGQWPAEGPSPETVRTYRWQLRWLARFALERGKPLLSDLTPDLLREAMAAKMAKSADHPSTHKGGEEAAHSLACAARRLASWLLAQGLPVSDLSAVKRPRRPERVQARVRQDEFRAIESVILHRLIEDDRRSARALVARDLGLLYLLADTGLRATEVCRMTTSSVDFATGSVVVFRGKGSKGRALSIRDAQEPGGGITLRLLADWIAERPNIRGTSQHDFLWVSYRGAPLKQAALRQVLARLCQTAGVDGNRPPHTFRRASFTESYLAERGSVNILAARMGWSPKSHHMVTVYTRGAEIDFARTTPIPSVAAQWHAGVNFPTPSLPLMNGHTTDRGRPSNERTPTRRRPTSSKGGRRLVL